MVTCPCGHLPNGGRVLRVLIVSEKAFEIKQVREFLQELPYAAFDKDHRLDLYSVDSAKAGIEKVEADSAKDMPFDLAIVSHKMKKMSGLQFALGLAQKKGLSPLIVFLLVDELNPQLEAEGAKANIADFLKMPLKGDDLKDALTVIAEERVKRLQQRRSAEADMLAMAGDAHAPALAELSAKAADEVAKGRMLAPWSPVAGMGYARFLAEGGRCAEAIPVLQAMVKGRLGGAEAHKLLAECMRRTGKSVADTAELEKMIAADPGSAELHFRLAEAYLREGETEKAVEHYKKAIACQTDGAGGKLKAGALAGLGAAYIEMGDESGDKAKYAEAFNELKNAVAIDPSGNAAYLRLVEALKKLGKETEAQALLEKAKKIMPETPQDWLEWFHFFLSGGDAARAKTALVKALEPDPENQVTLCLAGEAYLRQKMFAEAAELFEKAVAANPSDIRVYNWLGICRRNLKQGERAVECYTKALAIDPEDYNVHFNLARAYQMDNNLASAKASYEAALRYNPSLKEAQEALTQLPPA